ncbi:MAG: hypothetical protein ABH845_03325, partial [Candidatus Omnitrophota bacterium]
QHERGDSHKYHLLTFGFAPEQAFLRYKASEAALKSVVTIVDTKEISQISEEEARKYYLKFIREFPDQKTASGASIAEALSYRGRNLWWYLGITEKSIWLDKLIHHLYALVRFQHVFEKEMYDEVCLWVRDVALSKVIADFTRGRGVKCLRGENRLKRRWPGKGTASFVFSYLLLVCCEFVKLFLKLLTLRVTRIREENIPADRAIGFFSVYPLWWKEPFSEKATDLIFQTIPEKIEREKPIWHVLWLMPGHTLLWRKKGFEAFTRKHRVFILDSLLGFSDILSIFDPFIFVRFFKAFSTAYHASYEIGGTNISPLARGDLFRAFTSPVFFQCLLLDRCLQRVAFGNLDALFFRIEFQPIERALLYNTYGKMKTIGFQHSALGRNFLNYVFDEGELDAHWQKRGEQESMPLPDYILTSGAIGIEYMRRAGYPAERLAVGGSVRFSPLYEYREKMSSRQELRKKYGIPPGRTVVFVATAPLLQETLCMLADLFDAVKPAPERFHLVVKCHPGANAVPGYISKVKEVIAAHGKTVSLDFYNEPVAFYDYITLSDAVLLTGGTVALEAMLLGCVPIIYINDAQFSHNPMTEYAGAVIFVDGSDAMAAALKTITDRDAVEKLKMKWNKPLYDMFHDTGENPDRQFLSVLKNDLEIL